MGAPVRPGGRWICFLPWVLFHSCPRYEADDSSMPAASYYFTIWPTGVCCSCLIASAFYLSQLVRTGAGVGSWASEGGLDRLDFEIWHFPITFLAKKVVFLVSRGKNEISPLVPPPWKDLNGYLRKNPLLPPPKKVFPTPMSGVTKCPIRICTACTRGLSRLTPSALVQGRW